MWKRDEAPRPAAKPPASAPQTFSMGANAPRTDTRDMESIVNIGKSVVIKGELSEIGRAHV